MKLSEFYKFLIIQLAVLLSVNLHAQWPCNDWLKVSKPGDAVLIGDLDVTGTQLTVEAFFNRIGPYSPDYRYAGDIVSKHLNPSDVNYLLRPSHCELTTTNGFFTTKFVCDISFNKTYHAAMVYDGQHLRFYRNGFLISEVAATGDMITNDWSTSIGDVAGFPKPSLTTHFNGYINEVRIWKVAKSQSEIRDGMLKPLSNPSTQPGLVGYYHFNSLQNIQGNANWNGIVSGSAMVSQTNTACDFVADSCGVMPACPIDFWYKQDACDPLKIQFFSSDSSQSLSWNFGDGSPLVATKNPVHLFPDKSNYKVQLVYEGKCFAVLEKTISSGIQKENTIRNNDTTICVNGPVQLQAENALSYCWSPATYLDNPSISNPVARPVKDITYRLSSKVAAANLITNGDFSAGNSGFVSAYQYLASGLDPGIYYVANSPNPWHPSMPPCKDHTTGTGNMMLVNGANVPGVKIWTQNINITPNTHFEFSCWVQNISSSTLNPCQLQFYINGLPLGPVFSSLTNSCQWTRFFTEWNSGSLTKAEISLVNQNTGFTGNDFALDDISFTPIVFKEDSVTIFIEKPAVKAGNDTTICQGSSAQLRANGAQSYSWQPATGLNTAGISNPIATPSITTDYVVTGVSAIGCTAKDTVRLSVSTTPKPIDFSFQRNICNPLEVQFFNSGGNPVYWSFGDGSAVVKTTNPTHLFPEGKSFIVKMWTDGTQPCEYKDTIARTVELDFGYADIITTRDTTICENKGLQLQSVQATEYCWSPGIQTSNAVARNPTVSPANNATYYLRAKLRGDELVVNGDFSSASTGFVSEYDQADIALEGRYAVDLGPGKYWSNAPACTDHTSGAGNMMMVNGASVAGIKVWTQTIKVSPNTLYEFSCWVENISRSRLNLCKLQFAINDVPLFVPFRSDSAACVWKQFFTNWNSGSATTAAISIINQSTDVDGNDFALDDISFAPIYFRQDSVVVKIDRPSVAASNDTLVCPGSVVSLNASGGLTYSWSPTASLSNPLIQSPTATVNGTTRYIVTGTSAYGCVAKDTVTVSTLIPPIVSVSSDTTLCETGPIQLMASGAVSYTWSPSISLSNAFISNPIASPSGSTLYKVAAKDANGCSSVDSVYIKIATKPAIKISNDTSVCITSSVQLQASGGQFYSWSPQKGISNSTISNPIATPQTNTKYVVKVTNSDGCSSSDSVFVGILPNPQLVVSKDTSICKNGTALLNVSGAASYSWTPSLGLSNNLVNNPTATPSTGTLYTVTGISQNGCTATGSVRVSILPGPAIQITPDTSICRNSSVILQATGGVFYEWIPSGSLNDPTISTPLASPAGNTMYYVKVQDASGCSARDSVFVSIRPPAQMGVKASNVSGCAGEKLQLEAFGADQYLWAPATGLSNPLIANPFLTLVNDEVYQVAVKETTCNTEAVYPVVVNVKPTVPVVINKSNDISCNHPTATLSAGTEGVTYTWSPATGLSAINVSAPVASPLSTITYNVSVRDAAGCTSKGSVEVKVIDNGDFRLYQLPNAFTPNRDGNNDCFGVSKWGNVQIVYFEIFNRWGQLVFNGSNSQPCWDGYLKGIPQPSGNFVYKLRVLTMCGVVEREGYVILIR